MATPDLPFVGRVAGVLALLILVFVMFNGDMLLLNQDLDNGVVELVQTHKGLDRVVCFLPQEAGEIETVVFDYADYTERILGHTARILVPDKESSPSGVNLQKFTKRFGNNTVVYKADFVSVLRKMEWHPGKSFPFEARKQGCDFVYILKSGEKYSFPRYPEAFDSRFMLPLFA